MSKQELFEYLKKSQGFKSARLEQAFTKIDRADFVRDDYKFNAYDDFALPLGFGSTISQPSTVLFMLNLLDPKLDDKILDVGSGSGWTAALLGFAVGKSGSVFGVEIIPELVEFANNNLSKYKLPWVKNAVAGRKLGLPPEAPFNKILASAAAKELPKELLKQLKIGGRAVLVVGNTVLKLDKVSETKINREEFPGFAFVPLML